MTLPHLPGTVSAVQLERTVGWIAGQQHDDGLIPWFSGHHADPWDHVEAAMALAVGGRLDHARAALSWCAATQAADGSWPMEIVGTEVREASVDANQCLYLAVGVWHHWLLTADRNLVDALWPTVRRAAEFVLDLELPGGAIAWSRDPRGVPSEFALLSSSACLVLSLRCALALAAVMGDPQPDWELALSRLAHAVVAHPDGFADKSRFSMDWYYPVLGGALRGSRATAHFARQWEDFVVDGRGIRCVSDRPWVTGAETCELVLALDAIGDPAAAGRLLRDMQFLRTPDGGYWTGWVFPEDVVWPQQQTTWTAAAVVLAADALARHTPANGLFRGDGLPALLDVDVCHAACVVAVDPR